MENFEDKYVPEPNTGCWLWLGGVDREGYGRTSIHHDGWYKTVSAHRYSYFLATGVNPELPLDHECNVRCCVNPSHLRPMTTRDNALRSLTGPTAINARKTHCSKGHEYTPENTEITREGWRRCRECRTSGRAEQYKFNKQRG